MQWSAGVVNHGDYEDLHRCLGALRGQSTPPEAIRVYDTGEGPERLEALRHTHPDVVFEMGPNRGYAGGANRVVQRLLEASPKADFVLVLNPDVELEPSYAQRLIDAALSRPNVAIATGKLLRPDRATLDTAGIVIPRHRRPRDRGSDQPDRGQFDRTELVDAASGAAMLLRVSSLDDLRIDGELFDESFFAYHEDTDLCWRARRLGWDVLYVPEAVGLHRRGWRRARRRSIPIEIRRHSFKNHYLQLVKNETTGGFVRNLPWLLGWELLRLGFVVTRDRGMRHAYAEAWHAFGDARRKRRLIQRKARRPAGPLPEAGSDEAP